MSQMEHNLPPAIVPTEVVFAAFELHPAARQIIVVEHGLWQSESYNTYFRIVTYGSSSLSR